MKDPAKAILKLIDGSARRLAVDAVVHALSGSGGIPRRTLRKAIRHLVEAGEIGYTYELGNSFLERSFNRPIQVTPRIILTPPGHRVRPAPPQVAVRLAPGAAFGYGQHPTTRMALEAVDTALDMDPGRAVPSGRGVLDLGTGSGVLIIAAVMLGMPGGLGLDVDPCALAEAGRNVALNGLQPKIRIADTPIESHRGRYSLVTANLRLPTLEKHRVQISGMIESGGMLIVSGIKTEERASLLDAYAGQSFQTLETWGEKGWAAILMRKTFR